MLDIHLVLGYWTKSRIASSCSWPLFSVCGFYSWHLLRSPGLSFPSYLEAYMLANLCAVVVSFYRLIFTACIFHLVVLFPVTTMCSYLKSLSV